MALAPQTSFLQRNCPPSRRLPVECDFSPDGLFEARFRVENTSNLREGEQLQGARKRPSRG